MASFIEFGDITMTNLLADCNCLELPPLFQADDPISSKLSFFVPEGNNHCLPIDELLLSSVSCNKAETFERVEESQHPSFAPDGSGDSTSIDNLNCAPSDQGMAESSGWKSKEMTLLRGESRYFDSRVCDGSDVENEKSLEEAEHQISNTIADVSVLSESQLTQQNHFQSNAEESSEQPTDRPTKSEVACKRSNRTDDRRNDMQSDPIVVVKPKDDSQALHLANELLMLELVSKPKAFVPRGFYNSSNWCYINATLQVLLSCPPFFHLLKKMGFIGRLDRHETSTPIMDCFVKLASEFKSLSYEYCMRCSKDIRPGNPFTPTYVYDMLSAIKSSLSIFGGQEDAEEFLSCILNGFHEEILQLFDHAKEKSRVNENRLEEIPENCSLLPNGLAKSNAEKVNSPAVNSKIETPISKIFRGEMCTVVSRRDQSPSTSYEPFFTLPVHVSTEHSWTIEDALFSLTERERFHVEEDGREVFRRQTIETLPPILILHMKRFVYDKYGGSMKIDKRVHFKTDLYIRSEWLSEMAEYNADQRTYKLVGVVYHHGVKATGGHYSADVFHIGITSWLRIDDQHIWKIQLNDVLSHNTNRTPYLLLFRQLRN